MTGIVPKMATRFTSYEWYKQALADEDGNVTSKSTFLGTFNMYLSIWSQD
jgi:solute carrier family 25 citrate transporter 1